MSNRQIQNVIDEVLGAVSPGDFLDLFAETVCLQFELTPDQAALVQDELRIQAALAGIETDCDLRVV